MTNPRTLIIGSPRSGTSWVAKLLDAHPWVVYRHEPDSTAWTREIPGIVDQSEYDRYLRIASSYLDRIFNVSTVKTNAGKVRFKKAYRGAIAEAAYRSTFLTLRVTENIRPLRKFANRAHIPQFVRPDYRERIHEVAKSVIAGGRAGLYAHACPDYRFILIVRHPAGVVGSEIRGKKAGKLIGDIPIRELATMPGAQRRGLTEQVFRDADFLTRMSWWWLLFNEKMIEDTRDCENCMLVNYDEMCAEPAAMLERIYEHAGLAWSEEVSHFLRRSTSAKSSTNEYFNLFHDPQQAANRWRKELSSEQIDEIRSITENSVPGSMFQF